MIPSLFGSFANGAWVLGSVQAPMVAIQLVSELLLHFGHKAICSKDEALLLDTHTVQTEIN